MGEPITLYGVKDVARVLGVGSAAVCNWRRRGSGPLPDPAFATLNGHPLWTVEQLEDVLAAQMERLRPTECEHKWRTYEGIGTVCRDCGTPSPEEVSR